MKIITRIDTISWNDKDYKVTWIYTPSTPDVWYLSNGDPGYPGSPEEAEIQEMLDVNTNKCLDLDKLTDEQFEEIDKILFEIIDKEDDFNDLD